jgi:hypothetical protein
MRAEIGQRLDELIDLSVPQHLPMVVAGTSQQVTAIGTPY